MSDPINLVPKDSINLGSIQPTKTPEDVATQTEQAVLAADELGVEKDPAIIQDQLIRGNESAIRTELAVEESTQNNAVERELSKQVLEDPSITPQQKNLILAVPPENPEDNAHTVIERQAAKSLISSAISGNATMALLPPDQAAYMEDQLARSAFMRSQQTKAQEGSTAAPLISDLKSITEQMLLNPVIERDVISELQDSFWDFKDIESIRHAFQTLPIKELGPLADKINSVLDSRGFGSTNHHNKVNFWHKVNNETDTTAEAAVSGAFQLLDLVPFVGAGVTYAAKATKALSKGLVSVRRVAGDLEGASKTAKSTLSAVEDGSMEAGSKQAMNAAEEGLPPFINIENADGSAIGLSTLINDFGRLKAADRLTDAEKAASLESGIVTGTKDLNSLPAHFIEETLGSKVEINTVNKVDLLDSDTTGIQRLSFTIDKEGVPFIETDVAEIYAETVMGLKKGDYTLTDPSEGGVFIKVERDVPTDALQFTSKLDKTRGGFLSVFSRDVSIDKTTSAMMHLVSDLRSKATELGNKILAPIGKLKGDDLKVYHFLELESRKNRAIMSPSDLAKISPIIDGRVLKVTPKVIEAYNASRAADHLHFNALNSNVVRDMHENGYSNFSFTSLKGKELDAVNFNGKEINYIPDVGHTTFFDITKGSELAQVSEASLKDMLGKGYKLIKLHPDEMNLLNIGDKNYNFILAKKGDISNGPLRRTQLHYVPGGRVMYDGSHTIAQMNSIELDSGVKFIRRPSTRHIGNVREMTEGVESLEKLRELYISVRQSGKTALDATDTASLSAVVQRINAGNLSKFNSWQSVITAFEGVPHMNIKPIYNWKEPFELVKVGDTPKGLQELLANRANKYDLEDLTNTSALQDAVPLRGYGSKSKRTSEGLKNLNGEPAALMNPSEIAAKTMQQAAYQKIMKPFSKQVADRWVKTYGHLIRQDLKEGLTSEQLMDVASKSMMTAIDNPALRAEAMMFKRHWDNFRNVETVSEKFFKGVMHSIADGVGLKDTHEILGMTPRSLLTELNPFRFLKGYTFHTTLGVLSPHNFILQGSAILASMAMEPVRALRVSALMPIINAHLINKTPALTDMLVKGAAKLPGVGLSEVQIKQLLKDIVDNGKYIVGSEHGYHHTVQPITIAKTMTQRAGEISALPFNTIEREMSIANYSIAWIKWHEANPGKMLSKATAEANAEVSKYADILGINMRQGGANLTQGRGLTGAILQMVSYPQHFIETFFHSSLTKSQKFSLGLSQAALWGTGGVLGANTVMGVGSMDVTQTISDAIEFFTGEKPSKETLVTIQGGVVDGFLQNILGTSLTSQNLGPGLLDQFYIGLGDKNLKRDKILGVGYHKGIGLAGFMLDIAGLVFTLPDPDVNTLDDFLRTSNDFLENNIGTFSRLGMTSRGMRLGQYISKTGASYSSEHISKFEALTYSFGLKNKEEVLFWTANNTIQAHLDDIKGTTKMLNAEYQRVLIDIRENGDDTGDYGREKHRKFAEHMANELQGFSPKDKAQIQINAITRDNRDLTFQIMMKMLEAKGNINPLLTNQ